MLFFSTFNLMVVYNANLIIFHLFSNNALVKNGVQGIKLKIFRMFAIIGRIIMFMFLENKYKYQIGNDSAEIAIFLWNTIDTRSFSKFRVVKIYKSVNEWFKIMPTLPLSAMNLAAQLCGPHENFKFYHLITYFITNFPFDYFPYTSCC